MKSYFCGGQAMFRVYSKEICDKLEFGAGLKDKNIYTREDILQGKIKDADIIFSTWGMPVLSEEEIEENLPNLKCIFYGAGSVQYFARPFLKRGVRIFSSWGANAVPVTEYTEAQIVLATKGFFLACRRSRSFEDRNKAKEYFSSMPGNFKTNVGIIGAGMIGRGVIERLKSHCHNVLVYDPFLSDEKAEQLGVKKAELKEIFASCICISNHVANLPETEGMFDYSLFSLMKDNGVFINTGRGAQVKEDDLIRALSEKPNRCAVLDVTMPEPPTEDSKLYTLENVFLTPHIAGSSGNETERMGEYMLDQFEKYSKCENCEYEVFEKMLETMA